MGATAFVYWYWHGAFSTKRPLPFQPRPSVWTLVDDADWEMSSWGLDRGV